MSTARKQDFTVLNYTVLESLGEGGMGAVYRGVHEKLGQEVAIKIMDPLLAKNPDLRERFLSEARIQVHLRHPGIVQLLNADFDGDQVCLILELVRGLSLDHVLAKRGYLPVDEALKIFTQVLSALGYAHKRNVVHRDIKPSNLIIEADGTTRITDFGIAKVLGDIRLTKTGTAMGSAAYMSPEQVLGKKDIDHRSDIYSLGVTFFEILTGSLPFGGKKSDTENDFLIKKAHVEQSPPDVSSIRAESRPN